jgi:hypothetical protein
MRPISVQAFATIAFAAAVLTWPAPALAQQASFYSPGYVSPSDVQRDRMQQQRDERDRQRAQARQEADQRRAERQARAEEQRRRAQEIETR